MEVLEKSSELESQGFPPWSLPNSPQLCNVWKKGYDSNILVSVNHTTWKMVFGFVVFTFRRKYTYFKYKIVLGFSFNLIFCISHSWLYEMTIAIARYIGLFKIKHRKTKRFWFSKTISKVESVLFLLNKYKES